MKFGKKLQLLQYEPWAEYYLDYQHLKVILEGDADSVSARSGNAVVDGGMTRSTAVAGIDAGGGGDDEEGASGVLPKSTTGTATSIRMMFMDGGDNHTSFSPLLLEHWRRSIQSTTRSIGLAPHLPNANANTTTEFIMALEREIRKILLFVIHEQGRIAYQLTEDIRRGETLQTTTGESTTTTTTLTLDEDFESLHEAYRNTALDLLRVVQFLDVNITGIRKIIKKHDKIYHKMKLAGYYWKADWGLSRLAEPLLQQDDSLGALVSILEGAFRDLHIQELDSNKTRHAIPAVIEHPRDEEWLEAMNITAQVEIADQLSSPLSNHRSYPTPDPVGNTGSGHKLITVNQTHSNTITGNYRTIPRYSSVGSLGSMAHLIPVETSSQYGSAEAILAKIKTVRQRLKDTSDFVQHLAAPLMLEMPPSTEEDQDEADGLLLDQRQYSKSHISNTLNLLSTFFYMTNYFIVAPTSASYATKLGNNPSLASVIIGMTSVAALVSTILYSWWTNHSYKSALVFASTCSFVGNILYALGLPFNSLTLVLVGRLVNGFGSARSINRRYIADAYTHKERTAASATFVAIGSLGMAAGPAMASILSFLTPSSEEVYEIGTTPVGVTTDTLQNSNKYWSAENAPGWVMATLWGGYLVTLILYFRDPPKREDMIETARATTVPEEQQPLLQEAALDVEEIPSRSRVQTTPIPVFITLFIYFVLKVLSESVQSSGENLSHYYFGWDSNVVGTFLAIMGLLVLPANMVVAHLSKRYEDRELIVALLTIMMISCIGILQYSARYPVHQYVIASSVAYISASTLEGPNMSLLSKTIPVSWSRGIFNIGLLATEAGTLGRTLGDVALSLCGRGGLEHFLNRAYIMLTVLVGSTLSVTLWCYGAMEPQDQEEN